jgi:Ras-related C3 botulinum toxin substrate 1
MTTNQSTSIKVVVVGDGAVGKTCMMISYTTDRFPKDYIPTVFDNYSANLMYGASKSNEHRVINLQMWDTAGQEDYDKLRCLSYPQTVVFLVVFSVISRSSFVNVSERWMLELEHYSPGTPIVLCGSKIDLRDDARCQQLLAQRGERAIAFEEASSLAKSLGVPYVECSSLSQYGLAKVFERCIDEALRVEGSSSASQKSRKQRGKKQQKCNLI